MPGAKEVYNLESLDSELKAADDEFVILMVYFKGCGACKSVEPHFLELIRQHENVSFLQADVNDVDGLDDRYEVDNVPTFIAIRQKKEIGRYVGIKKDGLDQLMRTSRTVKDEKAETATRN